MEAKLQQLEQTIADLVIRLENEKRINLEVQRQNASTIIHKKINIQTFKGVGDTIPARSWLEKYQKAASLYNWTNELMLTNVFAYLDHFALDWYFHEVDGSIVDWTAFKVRFINRFGNQERVSLTQLQNYKWEQPTESLDNFYHRTLQACSKAEQNTRNTIEILTNGLPTRMKELVLTKDPKTTNDWYKFVDNLRIAIGDTTTEKQQKDGNKSSQKTESATGSNSSQKPKSKMFCSRCRKTNHSDETCFFKDNDSRMTSKTHNKNSHDRKGKGNINNVDTSESAGEYVEEAESSSSSCYNIEVNHQAGESPGKNDRLLYFAELTIQNQYKTMGLIDYGASVNAIDFGYCKVKELEINKNQTKRICGVNNSFQSEGSIDIDITINNITHKIHFEVFDMPNQSIILGTPALLKFNYKVSGPSVVEIRPKYKEQDVGHLFNVEEEKLIEPVIQKFEPIFAKDEFDIGKFDKFEYNITLVPEAKPFHVSPRRISVYLEAEQERQIESLLDNKIIEESTSEWASPITFVRKPGKTPRMCGDYRILNKYTVPDRYPMQIIDTIINSLRDAKIYTILDIVRGYNHIQIAKNSRHLTAFTTTMGLYQWRRLPFGLRNAPACFQRMMKSLLWEHRQFCRAYFDDIVIFSRNIQEHIKHLEIIFKNFLDNNIKLNKNKCKFMQNSVKFCGYVVSQNTITRDSSYTEAIDRIKVPENVKEIQTFLGLANYGRQFIKDFAKLVQPINNLRRKNTEFIWDQQCQEAFETIKALLKDSPKLHIYDPKLETELQCDASYSTLGAVLLQLDEHNHERIIGYYSYTLSSEQLKFNIYTKEFLALIKAIKNFRHLLHGQVFKVVTDNAALSYIKTSKDVADKHSRWLLFIEEFNFSIIHRKSEKNRYADAMTRLVIPPAINSLNPSQSFISKAIEQGERNAYSKCRSCQDNTGENCKELHKIEPIEPPIEHRPEILNHFHRHRHNHIGINKMIVEISKYFMWKKLQADVKTYIENCHPCKVVNSKNISHGYFKANKVAVINERWFMDTIGPYTTGTNYAHILTIVDHASRFGQAYPMLQISHIEIIGQLKQAIQEYGKPQEFFTDNGSAFDSKEFQKFTNNNNIKHTKAPAYHQASNGIAERFNKTVHEAILKYNLETRKPWYQLVKGIVNRYNQTVHRITKETPYNLFIKKTNIHKANENTSRQALYDANRKNQTRRQIVLKPGDLVLLEEPITKQRKEQVIRKGPFKVIKVITSTIVEIDKPRNNKKRTTIVHVDRLRLYQRGA